MSSEAEWIELARKDDQAAFGRLVTAYQTSVYNLSYRMLGNAGEAEEAAQEAFLRAYTHLGSYDAGRPFRSWLLSIASHYCIDRLRRRTTWLSFEERNIMSNRRNTMDIRESLLHVRAGSSNRQIERDTGADSRHVRVVATVVRH